MHRSVGPLVGVPRADPVAVCTASAAFAAPPLALDDALVREPGKCPPSRARRQSRFQADRAQQQAALAALPIVGFRSGPGVIGQASEDVFLGAALQDRASHELVEIPAVRLGRVAVVVVFIEPGCESLFGRFGSARIVVTAYSSSVLHPLSSRRIQRRRVV